jgi:hypothetical protein
VPRLPLATSDVEAAATDPLQEEGDRDDDEKNIDTAAAALVNELFEMCRCKKSASGWVPFAQTMYERS